VPDNNINRVLTEFTMAKFLELLRAKPSDIKRERPAASTAEKGPSHDPPLPPGNPTRLDSLDDLERLDRTALCKLGEKYGPIFSAQMMGEICVCMVGHQLGRRFLQEHAHQLRPLTLELAPLIPKGFLRQMSGPDHLHYRRALVKASRALEANVDQTVLDVIVSAGLRDLAGLCPPPEPDETTVQTGPSPLLEVASSIATAMLITLFFGVAPGTDLFDRLARLYRQLGPFGLVWNLKEPQHDAYRRLCEELRLELGRRADGQGAEMADECVLAQLATDGPIDDTMLGNLVYMVEMGRQDIQIFLRWLIRYGIANPDALSQITAEMQAGVDGEADSPRQTMSAAEAFVLEVLRCDQSERLMRIVLEDITFDGYRIPKGSYARICMWEVHHDGDVFNDPYRFDPDRFRTVSPTNDQFSPFGIDNHQCPFGAMTIRIGTTLLRALARYNTHISSDGPVVRGAYHWEPSRSLRITMEPR
jgi:cytochrome P450